MGVKARVLLIVGAVLLAIALYFMPRKEEGKKSEPDAATNNSESSPGIFSVERFIEKTKSTYRPAQLSAVNDLESKLNNASAEDPLILDSIARAWDELKQPGISAYYYEKKAVLDRSEKNYLDAAYRYFDAYKVSDDTVAKSGWVEKAIEAYKKVIEINPGNLDAKTDLGICYAEGTSNPMQGIMLLREVVKENPEHENAQLNLGFLSVKSGQFDKAMERFDKVLKINPKRVDVNIYKGETALQMGKTEEAMGYFNKFMKESPDEQMKMQVEAYMKELKKTQ